MYSQSCKNRAETPLYYPVADYYDMRIPSGKGGFNEAHSVGLQMIFNIVKCAMQGYCTITIIQGGFSMNGKRLISLLMVVILSAGLTVSLTASVTLDTVYYTFFDEIIENEIDCTEIQFELLKELLGGDFIVPFDSELSVIPRVNFILPPEGDRSYFLIGVSDIPSPECIDFILSYTGIPRENAYIAQAKLVREVLVIYHDEEQMYEESVVLPESYIA